MANVFQLERNGAFLRQQRSAPKRQLTPPTLLERRFHARYGELNRWPRFAPRFWALTWDQQNPFPTIIGEKSRRRPFDVAVPLSLRYRTPAGTTRSRVVFLFRVTLQGNM